MPRLAKPLALLLGLLGALAPGVAPRAHAYALEASHWQGGSAASPTIEPLALHMQVVSPGPAFPSGGLQDGSTSWNQVVLNAIADWNQYISTLKLNGAISSQPPPTSQSENNHNDVLWDDTIYGESWGGTGTLGITLLIYDQNNVNIEVDILFNTTPGITWDSFRGNLQPVKSDLRRIALHELGHFLGLDHPDDANPPQNVAAIMNSSESNTYDLTADDIAGAQFLYGAPNSNPVIQTPPASQTVAQNSQVTFSVVAGGSGLTYQWQKNGVNISGATGLTFTINSAQVTDSGNYTVVVTNSTGSTTSSTAVLLVTAPPVFTVQPVPVNIASGRSAVFNAAASGSPTPTYQWKLNGAPISGATDPILEVSNAHSGNAGAYTCTATNSVSAVTSTSAALTVTTTSNPGRLINLSARAAVGTGNNILIGGFGVQGTGTKQLLVRGVGPALSAFFSNYLATPQLVLLDNSGAIVATNIGWGNAPVAGASTASEAPTKATTNLMNTVGAYSIAPGSGDTAMVLTMPAGNNTAQISGVGSTSGIALGEIYDADTANPPGARLINISARADVGTGNGILIGGFAISGATAETVLIRAVGPGLNDELPGVFPLSVVLNQPVLSILDHNGAVIYSNTVWGGDATIASAFGTTGAFSLNPAHADSVVLASLPPGNYTAQVSGLNSGTGIALCEIYEVP